MTNREFTVEEIEALVEDLESLRGGALSAAALIGCGDRAIPPLRSFLLDGSPCGIYQPRQLAVETLTQLGAKDVLLEYLSKSRPIDDAVVRMGEDAVRSTAARELSRWKTEDVFESLKSFGMKHLLPGVVETLGSFRRAESIAYLLWALGDGVCRSYAEDALRSLGTTARPSLVDTANAPEPSAEEENASSIQRRRWALRILADLDAIESEWPRLRNLLDEKDPEIVITTSRIALGIAPNSEKRLAVRRMIEMLPSAGWFLRSEARAAMTEHFDIAQIQVDNEIKRRIEKDDKQRALDLVLRLLVNLRNQALEKGPGRQ